MTISVPRVLRVAWVLSLGCVVVGSVLPGRSPLLDAIGRTGINDKVQHFAAYAVLAGLPGLRRFGCRRLGLVVGFVLVLGVMLEFAQIGVPGRACDWHDAVADICGVAVGVTAARWVDW
jgi:hypothetical protein